jgi:hypothetical protein
LRELYSAYDKALLSQYTFQLRNIWDNLELKIRQITNHIDKLYALIMKQEWTVELLGQKKGMELKLSAKAMTQCGQKNAAQFAYRKIDPESTQKKKYQK